MSYFLQAVLVPQSPSPSASGSSEPEAVTYLSMDVVIEGEQIAALGPAGTIEIPAGATVIAGTDRLLLPGFVNAHTHSLEMWLRGQIPPLPLELWLATLYEYPLGSPEQAYLAALLTAVETLLSGGTTVVDHMILLPGQELETIEAVSRAYAEVGIRAYLAPLLQDERFELSLPQGSTLAPCSEAPATDLVLGVLKEAIQTFHQPGQGQEVMVAPTGTQLCSDALFREGVALSEAYDLCRHTHLLETKAQQMLAQEKYGHSATAHLAKLGFLGPKTSLAHCVWLTDDEITLLATSGSTVIHNPLSNLRLGSGIAPLLKYRQQGVNVSLGCDGASSNDGQNMFEVLKIGSMLHNLTDFEYRQWISPQQVCAMASAGGAKGLGAESFGRLAVGQAADLVLYDRTDLSQLPATDPLGQLIWGRAGQVVDRVWVRGRQVVAGGEVLTTSVAKLKSALQGYQGWLTHKPEMRAYLEPLYRQVMGLGV